MQAKIVRPFERFQSAAWWLGSGRSRKGWPTEQPGKDRATSSLAYSFAWCRSFLLTARRSPLITGLDQDKSVWGFATIVGGSDYPHDCVSDNRGNRPCDTANMGLTLPDAPGVAELLRSPDFALALVPSCASPAKLDSVSIAAPEHGVRSAPTWRGEGVG